MYNFGKTANLKAQERKQMDRDLKRRAARLSRANIKPGKQTEDSAVAESNRLTNIAEDKA